MVVVADVEDAEMGELEWEVLGVLGLEDLGYGEVVAIVVATEALELLLDEFADAGAYLGLGLAVAHFLIYNI